MQDPDGLGLVIGLSKKSTNPEKKQVAFIRAFRLLANGSQSEAVKSGEIMLQDVIEAVNDVDIGTNLSVLTDEINKVEIGGPIKFRLSRRTKDDEVMEETMTTNETDSGWSITKEEMIENSLRALSARAKEFGTPLSDEDNAAARSFMKTADIDMPKSKEEYEPTKDKKRLI